MHFEQDGLHLTRSGYTFFAMLLLRGRVLHSFLLQHTVFEPVLVEIPAEEVAWRRWMREWMEQHRAAVETVQDLVFDVQVAKASREELEELHRVLQSDGLSGLMDAMKAIELKALHRALMDGTDGRD